MRSLYQAVSVEMPRMYVTVMVKTCPQVLLSAKPKLTGKILLCLSNHNGVITMLFYPSI